MKKLYKCLLVIILLSIAVILNNDIYAVESDIIPLKLEVKNGENITEKYEFEMIPLDEKNPMPIGTVDNKFNIVLNKSGIYNIYNIEFFETGDYKYKVYQKKGENIQISYDDTCYIVTISVTNSEDMENLEAHIVISKDNLDEKYDTIYFENEYYPPEIPVDTYDVNIVIYGVVFFISIINIIIILKNREKIY